MTLIDDRMASTVSLETLAAALGITTGALETTTGVREDTIGSREILTGLGSADDTTENLASRLTSASPCLLTTQKPSTTSALGRSLQRVCPPLPERHPDHLG